MDKKPNIFIFMTDHQRRESMPGYDWCSMPNLEKMAEESTIFDSAFCTAPHCCPARASFFSGLYPSEHGVWNNVRYGNTLSRGLAEGVRLWCEDLADDGYRMYYTGKWHVSEEEGPFDRGFELIQGQKKYDGIKLANQVRVSDNWEWRKLYEGRKMCDVTAERREGEIQRDGYPEYFLYGQGENPRGDEDIVSAALEHIRGKLPQGGEPWCMYVGTHGPHDPYFVPQRFLDMYDLDKVEMPSNYRDSMADKPALYRRTKERFDQLTDREQREALRHYLAFCTYEDYLFGQLVDALKEVGQYDNTIVIYLSDHGDYTGAHGLWTKGLPCFREAYSIPLMIRMPGGHARRVNDPVSLVDIAPTILDLAGIKTSRKFAGFSLAGYLGKGEEPERRKYLYTQSNGNEVYGIQRSIFNDEWKYVYNAFDYDELYDLKNDPGELCNLAGDPRYAELIRELSRELWLFARENHDTIINPYIMTAMATHGPGIIYEE